MAKKIKIKYRDIPLSLFFLANLFSIYYFTVDLHYLVQYLYYGVSSLALYLNGNFIYQKLTTIQQPQAPAAKTEDDLADLEDGFHINEYYLYGMLMSAMIAVPTYYGLQNQANLKAWLFYFLDSLLLSSGSIFLSRKVQEINASSNKQKQANTQLASRVGVQEAKGVEDLRSNALAGGKDRAALLQQYRQAKAKNKKLNRPSCLTRTAVKVWRTTTRFCNLF